MTPDLEQLAADARAGGRLGVDTEFMTEGRYWGLLCLVQVAVPDPGRTEGVRVELIDTLADDVDPAPLDDVLADPDVEVVLHAARQDVALLRRVWRTEVRGVFDTQVAAGFAGFPAHAGYTNLLQEALGVKLPKSAGFTRWDQRPLTEEQLSYARGDVLYLLELADLLKERLAEAGRLEWVRDESRPLEESVDFRDPDTAWRRLPRVNQLSGRQRAAAQALGAWRERTAQEEDRPVNSVVADAALVELARRQPADLRALERVRGVHPGIVKRRGRALVAAVAAGADAEPPEREEHSPLGLEPGDGPVIALAEALLRQRALDSGLAYEVLATRAELNRVVAAARRGAPEPGVRILDGWRRELVGGEVEELLAGRRSVRVDDDGRLAITPSD